MLPTCIRTNLLPVRARPPTEYTPWSNPEDGLNEGSVSSNPHNRTLLCTHRENQPWCCSKAQKLTKQARAAGSSYALVRRNCSNSSRSPFKRVAHAGSEP